MKGYVIVATGIYIELAELLARSIKFTQTINSVALITDDYKGNVFDHVIRSNSSNVMEIRTQIYDLSPFEETVSLDADMVFLNNVDHWWDHLSKFDLLITDKVKDYRGNIVTVPYRNTFIKNDLPNCYSAFTYFKKNNDNLLFFNTIKEIVKNWEDWTDLYTPLNKQKHPSLDLAMSIAAKHLSITQKIFTKLPYPTFTHMKTECQNWPFLTGSWQQYLALNANNSTIELGNYIQDGILHYVDKDIGKKLLHLF